MQESASKFEHYVMSSGGLSSRACSLCGCSSFEILSNRDRYGFDYPTGMCKKCGLVQQAKYYSESQLQHFYSHFYRDIYDSGNPEKLFELQRRTDKPFSFVSSQNPVPPSLKKLKVLDLGCGAGGNLVSFRNSGWDCLGVDFDERYVLYGRERGGGEAYSGWDQGSGSGIVL